MTAPSYCVAAGWHATLIVAVQAEECVGTLKHGLRLQDLLIHAEVDTWGNRLAPHIKLPSKDHSKDSPARSGICCRYICFACARRATLFYPPYGSCNEGLSDSSNVIQSTNGYGIDCLLKPKLSPTFMPEQL
eukprot:6456502-Amphidinium_carterae.1